MKAVSVKELKQELNTRSAKELLELCLRLSKFKKETEAELLIYFCVKLKNLAPPIHKSTKLQNLYDTQIAVIRKKITTLHEDLRYDYRAELDAL